MLQKFQFGVAHLVCILYHPGFVLPVNLVVALVDTEENSDSHQHILCMQQSHFHFSPQIKT